MAGTTGSGKTTTETAAIIALALAHTRNELQFVILDPKRELKDDLENFSYLAWPVVAVTDEEIAGAIRFVADEFNRRRELPKEQRATLARLVIVIDEMALVGDKNPVWAETLDNVARLGRSLKMNLIVGVQEPHKSDSTKQLDGLLLNRFVGLVKSASDSYLVSGKAGLKAHELTGRGDFLHSHPDRGIFRFQAAMATAADLQRLPRGGLPAVPTPPPITEVQKPPTPPPAGGRPEIVVNPEYLAWYYVRFAEQAGWKAARTLAADNGDDITITRTYHEKHAPFVADFRRWVEKWSNGP
jgi:S-DNA-T family DNA segregation ATPase FtsK/SpoIIIE